MQQHICLVCSFVARHAKSALLEDKRMNPNKTQNNSNNIQHANGSVQQQIDAYNHTTKSQISPRMQRSTSLAVMPPPPARLCIPAAGDARIGDARNGLKSTAAATSIPAAMDQLSSTIGSIPIQTRQYAEPPSLSNTTSQQLLIDDDQPRPRSESLDERCLTLSNRTSKNRSEREDIIPRNVVVSNQYAGTPNNTGIYSPTFSKGRRRSASCSHLSQAWNPTIDEEGNYSYTDEMLLLDDVGDAEEAS
mmetsp:Transcript_25486/g.39123  ORF Transcript_25486/g.39123 Transcript_25486/m.39123 type:complete len:248 (+) Transcript_25486:312-1055(+)|eukprot:CAMPEP_0118712536 /NCGR_PEP_ID=MMETSP0800-20121206/24883_1 /TAXON_ID=210618 ORGANISM="Striatella unipunctata, Strain CCMP2910" /NCGR_SAMPLE_ID=MMETSP0800 /ASSEMBLY_ACC=CAM_ASM_000638 /LENGTH=247 /DNA_ID=CAMNT_0006617623 /DNA_START=530 /DNA_END=1273 /DNA_ORIENTATION=-